MARKDEEERSGGFGYTDDSGSRVSVFRDMINGGGAGRSGPSFEGSPLSTFANAFGIRPSGSDVPNPRQSAGLSDFVDGGGYGRSGQSFSGSAYSVLANALGIKPFGYQDRMDAARSQARRSYQPAATGFGNDFSNSGMNLGRNPYRITPRGDREDAATLEQVSARHLGVDPFQIYPKALSVTTPEVEQNELDPIAAMPLMRIANEGIDSADQSVAQKGEFDAYVDSLGPFAKFMSPEALTIGYKLRTGALR